MTKANITEKEPWLAVDVQRAMFDSESPSDEEFEHWVASALKEVALNQSADKSGHPEQREREGSELAIRIVDEEEGARLNEQWRHKKGSTNVLSFGMSGLDMIAPELLGDIVICVPVVKREAKEQSKTLHAHWAHMVIHGVLHLLGYDHTIETEAEIMERLETNIIHNLGYPNPYGTS